MPPAQQARFDQGHEIGAWAQRLHPDGVEVPLDRGAPGGLERTLELTRELLPQRRPIFEASFRHGRCYCRVDLLLPAPEGAWDLVEIKSSGSVKDVHLEDVAFQVHCLRGAGLTIRHACVMHVNTTSGAGRSSRRGCWRSGRSTGRSPRGWPRRRRRSPRA